MKFLSILHILLMLATFFGIINGYDDMHNSLAMEIIPQLLCDQNGKCTTVSIFPEESETTTLWDHIYDETTEIPAYQEEDPWFELVANRFQAIPPLSYQVKSATPVTNIVRLPDRQVIRPYRHRPIDLPSFPVSSTSNINTITDKLDAPTSTQTSVSNPISHVVVLKLLLLIAFVAVPIVASTLPIIMPFNHMTRSRRDDVIVNWATHSATLIALAHLASDDRLPDLLKLHDEAFVEALSDAVITPLKNSDDENDLDNRKTKQRISDSVLKLIQIVKTWDDLLPEEEEEHKQQIQDKILKSESKNHHINYGKKLINYFYNHRTEPVMYYYYRK